MLQNVYNKIYVLRFGNAARYRYAQYFDGNEYTFENIEHEHFIPTVGLVDVFCKKTNTVYEFQGCFWHGCQRCYTSDRINPVNQRDMLELRVTEQKNRRIRDLEYNLVEVYECELQKNTMFKKWCKNNTIDIVTPLNPRDAFFGGRTNVTKLTYNFKPNEYQRRLDSCHVTFSTNEIASF